MAILDVNDFVSHDPGKFSGASHAIQETRKDVDGSPGNSKGIELRILYDKETVIKGLRSHCGKKSPSDLIDITFDLQVVYMLKLPLRLPAEFPADPNLVVLGWRTEGVGELGGEIGAASD
jgi:hypothetical protein